MRDILVKTAVLPIFLRLYRKSLRCFVPAKIRMGI